MKRYRLSLLVSNETTREEIVECLKKANLYKCLDTLSDGEIV
jgi:hypothetical protein